MISGLRRWQRVSVLFDRAVELNAEERERLLTEECTDDPSMRAEIERLLAADGHSQHLEANVSMAAGMALDLRSATLRTGEKFGPYRIEGLINLGGMGEVYLARREGSDFDQVVALKLMRPGLADTIGSQRFLEERRLLARLEHPHIASLYDGGLSPQGQPWFAMEYVNGAYLTDWCDQRKLSIHSRLGIFAKICDAVDYAHRHLIVHRDIKPANLLVDGHGEPRLLDFGVAKLLSADGGEASYDTMLLTPEYAAPEQLRRGPISTATDIYSLGAVLFELLTGNRPFDDPLSSRENPPKVSAMMDAGSTSRAAARSGTPRSVRCMLSGDLNRIVRAALDPEPSHRYRSAAAFADDLRAVCEKQPISLRSDKRYRMRKFLVRHRWSVTASAAAAITLSGALFALLWQAKQVEGSLNEALATKRFALGLFENSDPMRPNGGTPLTAVELLHSAARRVETELTSAPRAQAELRISIGTSLRNFGDTAKALPLIEKGVMQLREIGGDKETLASALQDLAVARQDVGDIDGAERDINEALGLLKSTDKDHRLARVKLRTSLARLANSRGHPHDALVQYERILYERSKMLGKDSPATAVDWNNLGSTYLALDRFQQAEQAYGRATQLVSAGHGPSHPRLIWIYMGSAYAQSGQGKLSQAESMFARAEGLMRKTLLPDHPIYVSLQMGRGTMYLRHGRLAEAEVHAIDALHRARAVGDADKVAEAESLQGRVLLSLHRYREAEALLVAAESALANRRDSTDAGRWRIHAAHAMARFRLGYRSEAEMELRRALTRIHAEDGVNSEDYAESACDLANLLEETGSPGEAKKWRALAHAHFAGMMGPERAHARMALAAER